MLLTFFTDGRTTRAKGQGSLEGWRSYANACCAERERRFVQEIAEDLNTIRQEVERQDSRKWVVLPNDQSLFSAPWSRESGRAPSAGGS